jgi:hypothetical protein
MQNLVAHAWVTVGVLLLRYASAFAEHFPTDLQMKQEFLFKYE